MNDDTHGVINPEDSEGTTDYLFRVSIKSLVLNNTGAGVRRIYVMFAGASTCPTIGGLTYTSLTVETNGVSCRYVLD